MHRFLTVTLVLTAFALPLVCQAGWQEEKTKIEKLIKSVEGLEANFVRNGKEYPPKEAASHLKRKWERAMDSWFAPKKETWTAAMFIEKVAAESSLSGKPYLIKFPDGRTQTAKEWLKIQLSKQ